MKNLLLTTTFFFLVFFKVQAQYIALYDEPEIKISQDALNWENQKIRSDLTLTDKQFEQVKEINLERTKARSIVAKMFKYEPNKLERKLQEIDSQFDGEYADVLTDKQFKKYLTLQARKANQVKDAEQVVAQPEGPNFNAQIQQMISKVTVKAVDSSLLPKQDTVSQELVGNSQDTLKTQPTGMQKEAISLDPEVIKQSLIQANESEPKHEAEATEQEAKK